MALVAAVVAVATLVVLAAMLNEAAERLGMTSKTHDRYAIPLSKENEARITRKQIMQIVFPSGE